MKTTLTAERVREVLDYQPDTGTFTWKVTLSRRAPAGNRAGAKGPGGRIVIVIDGHHQYATRLAWLYMHGEWPLGLIVPKNGRVDDLRFDNLLQKTASELRSDSKINTLNTSGIKGVSWSKAKARWVAHITRDGHQHYLGGFATKEEAAEAYRLAASGERALVGGSKKDWNWANSRRQRSAPWKDIQRDPSIVGWESLEQFIADVGEPPTTDHVLMRVDYGQPLGPGNVMWRLPWQKRAGHEAEPQRSYNLGLRFDISAEEYDRLYAQQAGLCAICARPETNTFRGKVRQLSVDHHHADGYVRQLLCFNCNAGLGVFGEDPERLRAAADYIERHAGKFADKVVPLRPKESA